MDNEQVLPTDSTSHSTNTMQDSSMKYQEGEIPTQGSPESNVQSNQDKSESPTANESPTSSSQNDQASIQNVDKDPEDGEAENLENFSPSEKVGSDKPDPQQQEQPEGSGVPSSQDTVGSGGNIEPDEPKKSHSGENIEMTSSKVTVEARGTEEDTETCLNEHNENQAKEEMETVVQETLPEQPQPTEELYDAPNTDTGTSECVEREFKEAPNFAMKEDHKTSEHDMNVEVPNTTNNDEDKVPGSSNNTADSDENKVSRTSDNDVNITEKQKSVRFCEVEDKHESNDMGKAHLSEMKEISNMSGAQLKDALDLAGGEMTADEQRKVHKLYNSDIIGKKIL